jgi:hypothetical protein
LLIVAGRRTRLVAFGLAIFTLLAAYYFHMNFEDRNQIIHFMKNLAIAGSFPRWRREVREPGRSMRGARPDPVARLITQ